MKLIGNGQNAVMPSPELARRMQALSEQIKKEFGDGNYVVIGKNQGVMAGGILASCSDAELPPLVNQTMLANGGGGYAPNRIIGRQVEQRRACGGGGNFALNPVR